MNNYKSVLQEELKNFLNYYNALGYDIRGYITVFNKLDKLITEMNATEKIITQAMAERFANSLSVRPYSFHNYISHYNVFARYLNSLEDKVRSYISQNISRGKLDVFISLVNMSNEGRNIKVDRELAEIYIREMKALINEYGIGDDITATSLMRMPDMVIIDNEAEEELYLKELMVALEMAVNNLKTAREQEGKRLADDIKARLEKVSKYVLEAIWTP